MKKNIFAVSSFFLFGLAMAQPATYAGWGKLTIDSGAGDQVEVKHSLFGRKTVVKDRLGDGLATSHSILGTNSEEVSVLGNDLRYHKGLFGFSSGSAQTMLGDSLSTHKGLFYRTTKVNVSGINALFGDYLNRQSAAPAGSAPTIRSGDLPAAPPPKAAQP